MKKDSKALHLASAIVALSATGAYAAPPTADLTAVFRAATPVNVYAPASYAVQVSNEGKRDALATTLQIELPRTANSPVQFLMGTLSAVDSRCTRSGTRLTCALGTIARGANTLVSFGFAFPHAERTLSFTASVSTSSSESNVINNTASLVPILTYRSIVVGEAVVNNKHCTGGTTLSSYLECTYAPSSITEHDVAFASDGSITTEDSAVTGIWRQTSTDQLYFEYSEAGEVIARFNGKAVDAKCFEGVTRFPLNPSYVSPYRVCLP